METDTLLHGNNTVLILVQGLSDAVTVQCHYGTNMITAQGDMWHGEQRFYSPLFCSPCPSRFIFSVQSLTAGSRREDFSRHSMYCTYMHTTG